MAKRAAFGNVRKLSGGKFQARYAGPDGTRHSAGTFASRKAALARLAEVQTDLTRGKWNDPRGGATPFSEVAEAVFKEDAARLAPRTLEGYRSLYARHLQEFSDRPLADIKVKHVDEWWNETMPAKGVGEVTRRNAYFLLSRIMRRAVRWEFIPSSPCMVEDAGKDVSKPRPAYSWQDARSVIKSVPAEETDVIVALWLMLTAHLRVGELCGLEVRDWNPKTKQLTIERQAQRVTGQGIVIRPTKTGTARTVRVLAPGWKLPGPYLKRRPNIKKSDPLVVGPMGGRISSNRLTKAWNVAREVAGFPEMHIHDLRAVGLTEVARHGTVKEVQDRGGHKTVAAAMKYQRSISGRDLEIAAAFDKRMGYLDEESAI